MEYIEVRKTKLKIFIFNYISMMIFTFIFNVIILMYNNIYTTD